MPHRERCCAFLPGCPKSSPPHHAVYYRTGSGALRLSRPATRLLVIEKHLKQAEDIEKGLSPRRGLPPSASHRKPGARHAQPRSRFTSCLWSSANSCCAPWQLLLLAPASASAQLGPYSRSRFISTLRWIAYLQTFSWHATFAPTQKHNPSHPSAARRSWGPSWRRAGGVAEEARTRGFAAPAFAGCAFVEGWYRSRPSSRRRLSRHRPSGMTTPVRYYVNLASPHGGKYPCYYPLEESTSSLAPRLRTGVAKAAGIPVSYHATWRLAAGTSTPCGNHPGTWGCLPVESSLAATRPHGACTYA